MNHTTRIEPSDSILDAGMKLGEGNPGALKVIGLLFTEGDKIDRAAAMGGGLAALFALDLFGIYGSRIWVLYKLVCNFNLQHLMALLRAMQMGLIDTEVALTVLNQTAATGQVPSTLNLVDIDKKVKEALGDEWGLT